MKTKNIHKIQIAATEKVTFWSAFFNASGKAEWTLAIITFLLFANTFQNDYGFDDASSIYKNEYVQKGIRGIPEILTNPYIVLRGKGFDYRPFTEITYAIEKSIFGENPHISHVVNVLLFVGIVLLLFYILENVWLKKNPDARELAFFICLLYAVHPVHTEVVASLKNREEIFAFGFALLWFLSFHHYLRSLKIVYLIFALLAVLLATVSKMVSIQFFFLGLFWLWWFEENKSKRFYGIALTIAVMVLGAVFLNALHTVSRQEFNLENPLMTNDTLLNRLGMCFDSILWYIRLLIIPYPLRFYYGYNVIPLESFFSIQPFVIFVLSSLSLIYAWVQLQKKNVLGFWVVSFFGTMSLYLQIVYPYTGIISERALFQSSLYVIALFGMYVYSFLPKIRYAVFGTVIAIFSILTIKRNFEWKDTLSLLRHDIYYSHLEKSVLANYFYTVNLLDAALLSTDIEEKKEYILEGEKYARYVIAINPEYANTYSSLANIEQYYYNNLDSAVFYYEKALQYNTDPAYTDLFYELGRAYCVQGKYEKAKPLMSASYQFLPMDSDVLYFYARSLYRTGEHDSGFAINSKLLQFYPNYSFGYLNQGWFWEMFGQRDSAAGYYQKAIDLGNRDGYLFNYLSSYYMQKGDNRSIEKLRSSY